MKRKSYVFLFVALVTVLVFPACSGSDGNSSIDTSPITLYAGDSVSVSGASSIISSNNFVAYVTKRNHVKGFHVGETSIKVNGKYSIPVTIKGKYSFYSDPIVNWGCDEDYVMNNQSQSVLYSSTSNMLVYENVGNARYLFYYFVNGKLKAVVAMVSTAYTSSYINYLAERFIILPYETNSTTYFVGMNALKLSQATIVDVLTVYNAAYLSNMYMQPTDYNSSSSSSMKILKNIQSLKLILRP